jgi:hypothetical protein
MRTWSSMKSDWVSDMYSSQDVRNARPCALSPSKLLGTPSLTLEGCDSFRGVVTGGSEAGGGGAMFLATSWLPMITINLLRVSFMAQVASACSLIVYFTGNPQVFRVYPYPYPSPTHTCCSGTGFFMGHVHLTLGTPVPVPVAGNPQVCGEIVMPF